AIVTDEPSILATRSMFLASALLDIGRADQALMIVDRAPVVQKTATERKIAVIRGRAYLAIARRHLADARRTIPAGELDPLDRGDVGETLMAVAGEDLAPASFATRRDDLDR